MTEKPLDTFNKFMVAEQGAGALLIMRPPRGEISHDDARCLMAWLGVLSGVTPEQYAADCKRVSGT